ncbi:MAG TPA: histidine phosphatase family protein [Capsulimonadaceae bacterium]
MHLLIVRHGETVWNVERRIQGWGNSDLTDRGKRQARQLRDRLRSRSLAAVYSSDLSRAVDTAEIIAAPHHLAVNQLRELRETSWGDWEGKTAFEINAAHPELWAKFRNRGREMSENDDSDDWDTTTVVPNGETLSAASARISYALNLLHNEHRGEDDLVLVVGHGGSLRFFVTLALGLPPRGVRRFHLDNASLTHIAFSASHSPVLRQMNDTGHHLSECES